MEKYCPQCFKKFSTSVLRCPEDGKKLIALTEKDLVGQEVDERYLIKSVRGKGGMGVVYVAEQTMLGRDVALKVLRRDIVQDESVVKRFMREAKAIASLKNPHTVTLYDFGIFDQGLLYYTMELLEGRPLSQLIKDNGPLSYELAVQILLQACESLEEAHDREILHRDLKPDNLFISDARGQEWVTVLDFGIAKLIGDDRHETITQTGMICGTPAYLSPEQAMGVPAVKASDLYSLGIVLYEMLAGEPPFRDTTPMKVLLRHLNEQPQPVAMKNPEVEIPESLDRFLKKALAKEPKNRYQTVSEFRDGLLRCLHVSEGDPSTVTISPLQTTLDGVRGITDQYAPEESPAVSSPRPKSVATQSFEPQGYEAAATAETAIAPSISSDAIASALLSSSSERSTTSDDEIFLPPGIKRGSRSLVVGLVLFLGLIGIALAVIRPWESETVNLADPSSPQETPSHVARTEEPSSPPAPSSIKTGRERPVDSKNLVPAAAQGPSETPGPTPETPTAATPEPAVVSLVADAPVVTAEEPLPGTSEQSNEVPIGGVVEAAASPPPIEEPPMEVKIATSVEVESPRKISRPASSKEKSVGKSKEAPKKSSDKVAAKEKSSSEKKLSPGTPEVVKDTPAVTSETPKASDDGGGFRRLGEGEGRTPKDGSPSVSTDETPAGGFRRLGGD
ncbi:MAG: protein kinase [Pseudomonadota bacterium]